MSNNKQEVNTSSRRFKEGVEAGLNSTENTRDWKAGNVLGQELKDESTTEQISGEILRDASIPLFMRDIGGGNKGNAQDEKDETEE